MLLGSTNVKRLSTTHATKSHNWKPKVSKNNEGGDLVRHRTKKDFSQREKKKDKNITYTWTLSNIGLKLGLM